MPKGTDVHVGLFWPQSKHIYTVTTLVTAQRGNIPPRRGATGLTLLAGLLFNFSNIFCDCCLVARALMVPVRCYAVEVSR
jgi:hypothetical protein